LVTTGLPELPPTLSGLILGLFCHFLFVFNTLELQNYYHGAQQHVKKAREMAATAPSAHIYLATAISFFASTSHKCQNNVKSHQWHT
jgi:hypothetical protein